MPGISISRLGIPFMRGGGINWAEQLFGQDDLSLWTKSRSGLELIDDFGVNPTILLPTLNINGIGSIYYADNGALDIGATDFTFGIWMEDTSGTDAIRYVFGKAADTGSPIGNFRIFTYSNGLLYFQTQTTETAISIATAAKARTYGKILVIGEIDQTAHVVRFFMNNVQVGTDQSFTGTFPAVDNKYELCVGCVNTNAGTSWTSKFIGKLADAFIARRILTPTEKATLLARGTLTNLEVHYPLDIFAESLMYDHSGNNRHLTAVTIGATNFTYTSFGSRLGLNNGYDIWIKPSSDIIKILHTDTGGSTLDSLVGYTKYRSVDGSATKHNGARSKLLFTNDFFDRSNTTIYSAAARSTLETDYYKYYDLTAPKSWHILELTGEAFSLFFNDDYKNRLFVRGNNNAYDTDKNLQEIALFDTKKTGNDLNKVLMYFRLPYQRSGFAIAFDDTSAIVNNDLYMPMLKLKYNLKCSFFVTALTEEYLNSGGKANMWLRYRGQNHCLANHTVNHIDWVEYISENSAQDYYDTEIAPLQGWMNTLLGANPIVFGYCQVGGSDEDLNTILFNNGFNFVRPGIYGGVPAIPPESMYDGTSQLVEITTEGAMDQIDPSDFYAMIDYAKTHNLIFLMLAHNIVETEVGDGSLQIVRTRLEQYLQYIINKNMKFYRFDELLPTLFA